MIIDSFIFNDELDILEFRLELLWDKVDNFILVEADTTHIGTPKPFYFLENKERFKWAQNKIEHYMFSPAIEGLDLRTKPQSYQPDHAYWKLESQQRNAIIDIARQFQDNDILIISDCDEIPSYEAIDMAKAHVLPLACQQDLFYYNLRNLCNQDWRGSIFITVEQAKNITPQELRDKRNALPAISWGGWHLSWFGDIAKKLDVQAHQELNIPEFNNEEHIQRCVKEAKDLFNRDIFIHEVDSSFFPEYFNSKINERFQWQK